MILVLALLGCGQGPSTPRQTGLTETATTPPTTTPTTNQLEGFKISGSLSIPADRGLPTGTVRVTLFGIDTWYAGSPDAGWVSVEVGPLLEGEIPFEIDVPAEPPDRLLDNYPYNTKYGGKFGGGVAHIGIGAYIDIGDAGPDDGDAYVATHASQLVFSYTDYDYPAGWSVDTEGSISGIEGQLSGVTLRANLLPIDRGELSAQILNDRAGQTDQHLALLHDDDPSLPPLVVVSGVSPDAGAAVNATLPVPPKQAEQGYPVGLYTLRHTTFAPYVGHVWSDTNGDGLPGEPVLAATPESLDGIRAIFVRPVWFANEWKEDGTGWYLIREQETQILVPWVDGMILEEP